MKSVKLWPQIGEITLNEGKENSDSNSGKQRRQTGSGPVLIFFDK